MRSRSSSRIASTTASALAQGAAVGARCLQRPPAVFPLEERVVDRVGHAPSLNPPQCYSSLALTLKVVLFVVLLPAASVTVIVTR